MKGSFLFRCTGGKNVDVDGENTKVPKMFVLFKHNQGNLKLEENLNLLFISGWILRRRTK
jgi:hypothetical protein